MNILTAHSIIEFATKDATKSTKNYLVAEEKLELADACGLDGFFLFDHYLAKAHVINADLSDEHIAKLIKWPARKVQATRLKLLKAKWFYQTTYRSKLGHKLVKTSLGLSMVSAAILADSTYSDAHVSEDIITNQIQRCTNGKKTIDV